jgi:hypothetical protein
MNVTYSETAAVTAIQKYITTLPTRCSSERLGIFISFMLAARVSQLDKITK